VVNFFVVCFYFSIISETIILLIIDSGPGLVIDSSSYLDSFLIKSSIDLLIRFIDFLKKKLFNLDLNKKKKNFINKILIIDIFNFGLRIFLKTINNNYF
jgi:hypothetical protein